MPAPAAPGPFGRAPAALRLVSAAQMAAADAFAQRHYGLAVPVLMENAGRATADLAQFLAGAAPGPGPAVRRAGGGASAGAGMTAAHPPAGGPGSAARGPAGRIVLAAGKGNNGGDALCAARHLANRGLEVAVFLWAGPGELGPAAAAQWRALEAMAAQGLVRAEALGRGDPRALGRDFGAAAAGAALVVDGLLGIGAGGAPRPPYAVAVAVLNAAGAPILALDIPTGIDPDTGAVPGDAVHAQHTLTYGWAKPGLFLYPGAEHAGTVWVGELGFHPGALDAWAEAEQARHARQAPQAGVPAAAGAAGVPAAHADVALADGATIAGWLAGAGVTPRRPAAHKGDHGRVGVVGGAVGTHGAAILAARGALSGGAGLVLVLVPEPAWGPVARHLVEAMVRPVAPDPGHPPKAGPGDAPAGGFGEASAAAGPAALAEFGVDAVCMGPGLGRGPGPGAVLRAVLEAPEADGRAPGLVIDADGLNVLAGLGGDARDAALGALARRAGGVVLTPHPGECARLLGTDVPTVEADRPAAAAAAARAYGAVVALKGRPTVVAAPDGSWRLNPTGNPVLASGGTGDVLAGIIAAFLGHGLAAGPAAVAGVYVHGVAADLLAARGLAAGVRARDVARAVPAALGRLGAGEAGR